MTDAEKKRRQGRLLVEISVNDYDDYDEEIPPEEDDDWSEMYEYYVGGDYNAEQDIEWVNAIVRLFRSTRREYPDRWVRLVLVDDGELIELADGSSLQVGRKKTVLIGPDCVSLGEVTKLEKSSDDRWTLPVNLPAEISLLQQDGKAMAPGYVAPGVEVEEETEGVENTVTLTDEEGNVISTSTVESGTPIASGTEVKAVDELGREYTVTVV